jgi:hypothetical protein
MMEAVSTSEILVNFCEATGAVSQKAVISYYKAHRFSVFSVPLYLPLCMPKQYAIETNYIKRTNSETLQADICQVYVEELSKG